MKLATIFICAFITSCVMGTIDDIDDATLKEILEDPELAGLLDDPDKLLDLLKHKLRGQPKEDAQQCYIATNKLDTIIKTKESQDRGATFISVPTVLSRKECISACCNITTCNTAIIKEKVNEATGCYLFDCHNPNVCVFSSHTGFSSVQFYSRESDIGHREKTQSTTTVSTTFSISRGQLYSSCSTDSDCLGGHRVECSTDLVCLCRHGFHAVDGVCRADCGRYEFECLNIENPEKSECVAIYFHCDGSPHCGDGSDEINCRVTGNTSRTMSSMKPTSKPVSVSSTTAAAVTKSTTVSAPKTSSPNSKQHSDVDHGTASTSRDNPGPAIKRIDVNSELTKGAVVALILGITIVLLLVIFIGCHMGSVRRRPWKGRLRTPADEDYLVNGMYL